MADFESAEWPKRNSRGGRMKVPKGYMKAAFITKSVVKDNSIRQWNDDGTPIPNEHLDNDQFGLHSDEVVYSLNKKQRWKYADSFRHQIADLQRPKVKISAVERYERPGDENASWRFLDNNHYAKRGDVHAYHSVDENGGEMHKYSKKHSAHMRTLTEKPLPKRKRRNGRFVRERQPLADPNDDSAHIRYQLVTHFPNHQIWLNANKKRYDNDPSYDNRDRRLRQNQTMLFEQWEVDDADISKWSMSDGWWPYEIPDQPSDVIPQLSVDLLDCVKVTPTPRKPTVTQRISLHSSSVASTSSNSSFESQEEALMSRPWLHRIPVPVEILQKQAERAQRRQQREERAPSLPDESRRPRPSLAFEPTELRLSADELEPEQLANDYGSSYYECQCVPRRFCVDLTAAVRDVLTLAHGTAATRLEVECVCVFEVAQLTLADWRRTVEDDDDDCPMSRVRFWVNGAFNSAVVDELLLRPRVKEGACLNEVIRSAVVHVATLPIDCYVSSTPTAGIKVRKLPRPTNATENTAALQKIVAKAKFVNESDLAKMALAENALTLKLQRQISQVRDCYDCFSTSDGSQYCDVCFESTDEGSSLCLARCQHWFCNDCWRAHTNAQLEHGLAPVVCPDADCDAVVDYDTLTTILPLNECRRYATLVAERHLLNQARNWVFCPADRCTQLLRLNSNRGNAATMLACLCGHKWCAECSMPVHWPASCKHAALYVERLESYGDHMSRAQIMATNAFVTVKRCPRCHMPMEKGPGCNHMSCRCGGQFCWSCLGDWTSGAHYNCQNSSKHGNETMLLRDVRRKRGSQIMDSTYYNKCVEHRQASFKQRHDDLRRAIVAARCRPAANGLLQFVAQVHPILEFTFVYLYYYSTKTAQNRLRYNLLLDLAGRLDFVIWRLEESCLDGQAKRVGNLFAAGNALLNALVDRLLLEQTSFHC